MGGLDPARDYVLRAMAAGKHVVTANKQLLSQHGEELWAAARSHGVQLRFEAAVAGVVPVIRVLQESLAARARRPPARDRQRDDELHPQPHGRHGRVVRGRAGRGAGAGLRRGRSHRGRQRQGRRGEDGDPRAAGLQHAGAPRPGALRGHRGHHRRRHGVRARPRAGAEADRDRRARRRRAERPRAPGLPLRRASAGQRQRALQRGDHRVAGDHRDHPERAGRRRPADRERGAGRRHQRDDPAGLDAGDDAIAWRS